MESVSKYDDHELLVKKTLIMKKFIKKYKSYSCMWNVNDLSYYNKTKRMESQKKLLTILKKIDPYATLRSVKSQINSLRSNFRKHLRIYKNSELFDPEYKSIVNYETHNWRFHSLKFLCPDIPIKNEDTDDHGSTEDDEEDLQYLDTELEVEVDSNPLESSEVEFSSPEIQFSTNKAKRRKTKTIRSNRKSKSVLERTDYQGYVSNSSETLNSSNCTSVSEELKTNSIDKELQAISANVAYKLQRMDPMQRCHAELLINKVLIYGLKFNLTEDTELTDFQRLD